MHSCKFQLSCILLSISNVTISVCIRYLYLCVNNMYVLFQMGSHMKRSIFNEQTSKALKKWHQAVKRRHKKGSLHSPSITPSTSTITSPSTSPLRQFYRSKTFGHSGRSQTHASLSYHSDPEISDQGAANTSPSSNLIPSFKHKDVDFEPAEYRVTVE